jgi:nascent polypeptide-associated complex subunit alpha
MEAIVMHRRMNPREQRRMMQRMGMNMDTVSDVEEVIIKTSNKKITIEQPEVAILEMQGQKIFQVMGGQITEHAAEHKSVAAASATPKVTEEDVRLVADQTGKSLNEAREALEECEGDLAKAILLLQS